jgi:hypothetical protein
MTSNSDDIAALQDKLAVADPANAPEIAEELARRLGEDLDASHTDRQEDPSDAT